MKFIILLASAAAISHAAQAQPVQHPLGHSMANPVPASVNADEAAVKAVLLRYKSAIEKLDASGTEALFTADSAIFETGGVEGSYANYLAKHLGPELGHFKSFKFSDYKVDVRIEGPVALATETYNYRIEPKEGEIAQRRGVATSVLKKVGGQWKIISMHNSARTPRPAS
jgi:uncharacterized protein (TIGR02246 family)